MVVLLGTLNISSGASSVAASLLLKRATLRRTTVLVRSSLLVTEVLSYEKCRQIIGREMVVVVPI